MMVADDDGDGILGMWRMQAALMALEVMAVQKGVFPEVRRDGKDDDAAQEGR